MGVGVRVLCRVGAAREAGGGGEGSEDGGDADGRERGVEPVEAGSGDEDGRHGGHAGGAADLAHGLDQARGQSGGRLGDARERSDLHRRGAQPDPDAGEQERGSRSVTKPASDGTRVSQSTPTARTERPVTRSRRTPTAATSRAPANADARKAVAEVASQDRPVFVGEYPRTCCISSEPRKMNEKKALKVKNAERLAATSVRFLSATAGTSGAGGRASVRTNAASSSAAAANRTSVVPEGQP